MSKKTSYDNSFKGKVALEAVRGDKTLQELSTYYNVAVSLISRWKSELLKNVGGAFGLKPEKNSTEIEEKLYKQIGKLTMEVDFLKKFVSKHR